MVNPASSNPSKVPSKIPVTPDSGSEVPTRKPKPALPGDDLTLPSSVAAPVSATSAVDTEPNRFKRFLKRYWARKLWTIPLTLLFLAAVLLLVPTTRYAVLGLFLKENFQLIILDPSTQKPVSNAQVRLGDITATTDNKGRATIHTKVGMADLSVSKKYYKTSSSELLVPISQKNAPFQVSLQATGRQVPVTVINKVTGRPIEGATIAAADTEAKTGKDGKVVIVLPADKTTVEVQVSAKGLNTVSGALQVTEQTVKENSFQLVPSGKIYFLSRLSGKIDVVKTNLDGSERQTVLAGTGKENNTDTILLASRDWKYLALKSLRDGGANPKLFLIDTATDKLTTMDEGNAYFQAVGWAEHRFVYQVGRNGTNNWTPKAQTLKTYDAPTGKLVTIDETHAEGTGQYDYAFNQFGQIYIMDNELVYHKNWISYSFASRLDGKQISLVSVRPDGSARRTVKDFPVPPNTGSYYVQSKLYAPQELYLQVPPTVGDKSTYFEYENGKIEAKPDVNEQQYNEAYATYLVSPSGKQTFWVEERDGKNTLFVGGSDGQDGKQVASLSEYTAYGWYTDDYLFVSKDGSELYIMPVTPGAGSQPFKVSDYHKPNYNFQGYGYGYGGL